MQETKHIGSRCWPGRTALILSYTTTVQQCFWSSLIDIQIYRMHFTREIQIFSQRLPRILIREAKVPVNTPEGMERLVGLFSVLCALNTVHCGGLFRICLYLNLLNFYIFTVCMTYRQSRACSSWSHCAHHCYTTLFGGAGKRRKHKGEYNTQTISY